MREAAALYAIPAKLFALAFGLGNVGSGLLYPAFAEQEGAGERARQSRLLLAGLRGGTAAAVLLALPLLLIPDQLIEGWVGDGYGESSPVMALLALVLLVHQPIYLVTQFLIARARQREIARVLVGASVGEHRPLGRARLDCRDLGRRAEHAPDGRRGASVRRARARRACGVGSGVRHSPGRRSSRCFPASQPALVVLVAVARIAEPDTLLELLPLGLVWGRGRRLGAVAIRSRRGGARRVRSAAAPSGGSAAGRFLAARQVPVEDLLLVPASEYVPVERGSCSLRRGRQLTRAASSSPRWTTASTNSRGVGTSTPAPVSRRFSVTS